ncbi:lipopolysaccharide heptosyltransferase II [bacterium]|nr:MAG: lipopolysaccharide heptosyltransferase II [bacterium]
MEKIEKILFITLSNIGDVILTLPTLDYLRERFPEAKITVMSGSRPAEIFENNPLVQRLIIYDKNSSISSKIKLFFSLSREKFDLVVDLRNSFMGAVLPAKHKTSPFLRIGKNIQHMRDKHLYRLLCIKGVLSNKEDIIKEMKRRLLNLSLYIEPEDDEYIKGILKENDIDYSDNIIVLSIGARSHIKRWPKDKFAELLKKLAEELKAKIVLVGDKEDMVTAEYVLENSPLKAINLCSKTNLAELACVLRRAKLLITNDSANLHLAGYLNVPTLGIFGPTDENKYGPWADSSLVVKKDIFCRPCNKAQCFHGDVRCLSIINTQEVADKVKSILSGEIDSKLGKNIFKRILVVRTDRIGDVLLSTPVFKALRKNYPDVFMSVMVSPYAKEVVEGNPYIDEVIIYDKDNKHRSWRRSIKFARRLKKRDFDLTLILHPTNRVHIVTFLAGIPRRIGYNRKLGFLLTEKIKHMKQYGQKHETEYVLEMLKPLGIGEFDSKLFMPLKDSAEEWVKTLLKKEGLDRGHKILAINPGASCVSKVWPAERFAETADRLIEENHFKVILVGALGDIKIAQSVISKMRNPVVNLAGKTTVSELASIIKRCSIFISNDSGPVHIASALGVPVISIFGRSEKGLGPLRWAPLGKMSVYLHKPAGCIECLAHNCRRQFICLKNITVDDVMREVRQLTK